jgi:hypothetical protein
LRLQVLAFEKEKNRSKKRNSQEALEKATHVFILTEKGARAYLR